MTKNIDTRLTAAALELLERLEQALAPDSGVIVLAYNRSGRDLELTIVGLNDRPGEVIRVMRAAVQKLTDKAPS